MCNQERRGCEIGSTETSPRKLLVRYFKKSQHLTERKSTVNPSVCNREGGMVSGRIWLCSSFSSVKEQSLFFFLVKCDKTHALYKQ